MASLLQTLAPIVAQAAATAAAGLLPGPSRGHRPPARWPAVPLLPTLPWGWRSDGSAMSFRWSPVRNDQLPGGSR